MTFLREKEQGEVFIATIDAAEMVRVRPAEEGLELEVVVRGHGLDVFLEDGARQALIQTLTTMSPLRTSSEHADDKQRSTMPNQGTSKESDSA